MANVCLPNALKLGEEIESWANSKKAKNTFKEPYSAAFRLVETEFLMSIQDIGARKTDITKGQLGSFKQRLTDLDALISKGTLDSAFSTAFWQTSKFGKKDPVIGAVLREMQKSNFYFREHFLRYYRTSIGLPRDQLSFVFFSDNADTAAVILLI